MKVTGEFNWIARTGELLHLERRRSDFIENLHDGSYFDYVFGTKYGQIKLVYTSIMGTALLVFTITGFWLWYGPKRFRAHSKYHRHDRNGRFAHGGHDGHPYKQTSDVLLGVALRGHRVSTFPANTLTDQIQW